MDRSVSRMRETESHTDSNRLYKVCEKQFLIVLIRFEPQMAHFLHKIKATVIVKQDVVLSTCTKWNIVETVLKCDGPNLPCATKETWFFPSIEIWIYWFNLDYNLMALFMLETFRNVTFLHNGRLRYGIEFRFDFIINTNLLIILHPRIFRVYYNNEYIYIAGVFPVVNMS